MIYASESVELKEILSDDINKEIVAFANEDGGIIYLGIDDQGTEVGLQNVEQTYTRLTNIIRDTILPDVTMFVHYELLDNHIIKVSVLAGSA